MSVSYTYQQMAMVLAAAPSPTDARTAFIAAVTWRLPTGPLLNQQVRDAINAALLDMAEPSTTFDNVMLRQATAALAPAISFAGAAMTLRPASAKFGPATSLGAAAMVGNP